MHILITVIAIAGALMSVLVAIDMLMFMLRIHGPFTATGEALLFVVSLGHRKFRFTKHLCRSPLALRGHELRSLLAVSGLGVLFWLSLAAVALYVHGPIKQVHEW
jgi:hypothetical protein